MVSARMAGSTLQGVHDGLELDATDQVPALRAIIA
jgi:hypothetical protein